MNFSTNPIFSHPSPAPAPGWNAQEWLEQPHSRSDQSQGSGERQGIRMASPPSGQTPHRPPHGPDDPQATPESSCVSGSRPCSSTRRAVDAPGSSAEIREGQCGCLGPHLHPVPRGSAGFGPNSPRSHGETCLRSPQHSRLQGQWRVGRPLEATWGTPPASRTLAVGSSQLQRGGLGVKSWGEGLGGRDPGNAANRIKHLPCHLWPMSRPGGREQRESTA